MASDKRHVADAVELRAALESMVYQFAYWSDTPPGGFWTGGLSALEEAFEVLGWTDPQPAEWATCDEAGCTKQVTCGTPVGRTTRYYRRTCGAHRPKDAALAGTGDTDVE